MRSGLRARAIAGLVLTLIGICGVHPERLWANEAQGATDVTVMGIGPDDSVPPEGHKGAPRSSRLLDQTGTGYLPPLLLAGSVACGGAVIALKKRSLTRDGRGRSR